MSGRRRSPEPAIPVGGRESANLAPPSPPEEFVPQAPPVDSRVILASTDPNEAPQPPKQLQELGLPDDDPDLIALAQAEAAEPEDLSPEEEVMFASLMTCGKRSKTIKVLDHTVVVETLNNDDDLRIGLFIKEYIDSIGESRAYQMGVAAAGIRFIDGRPLVTTLYADADQDALFDEKVAKIKKMYPFVVKRIYNAVLEAEKEFVTLVERLGKSNG